MHLLSSIYSIKFMDRSEMGWDAVDDDGIRFGLVLCVDPTAKEE